MEYKIRRRLFVVFIVLGGGLFAGCVKRIDAEPSLSAERDGPPVLHRQMDPDAVRKLFPLAVGAHWEYEVRRAGGSSRKEVRILTREGDRFIDSNGAKWIVDDHGLRDQMRYLIKSPPHKGQSWQANLSITVAERFTILSDRAEVSTPAGRFRNCIVVESRSWMPSKEERVIRRAYAPNVGLIRVLTFMRSGSEQPKPMMDMQLVSYEIPYGD